MDLDGNPVRYKGVDGLLAQALEHEEDHLNGILYVDLLRSKDDLYEVREGSEEDDEGEEDEEEEDHGPDEEQADENAPARATASPGRES